MGKGTATATSTYCADIAAVKTAIDGITLSSANGGVTAGDNFDKIEVVSVNQGGYLVIKVAFAAS